MTLPNTIVTSNPIYTKIMNISLGFGILGGVIIESKYDEVNNYPNYKPKEVHVMPHGELEVPGGKIKDITYNRYADVRTPASGTEYSFNQQPIKNLFVSKGPQNTLKLMTENEDSLVQTIIVIVTQKA